MNFLAASGIQHSGIRKAGFLHIRVVLGIDFRAVTGMRQVLPPIATRSMRHRFPASANPTPWQLAAREAFALSVGGGWRFIDCAFTSLILRLLHRSEERRVEKECRSR